ncbi:MAG TPA: DEAD/DEAH box helicase [Candidatus Brocadiia bacterium]|nr:DEAD/DEAH box helicase [Candidatus Brocadiia bacterium]
MDAYRFIDHLQTRREYRGQIVHVREIPAREAAFGDLDPPLPAPLAAVLASNGIARLYKHQVSAVAHVRAGKNAVIVTPTASGKTLCYLLPILESYSAEQKTTALMIYPTKALAQDQLRALRTFQNADESLDFSAGTYDGDTPTDLRRKLRDEGNFILTNPDMLHQGILPNHSRWGRFFTNLKYVVLDEIHTYRGVFGSNVANVLRRLKRVCAHYGSSPRFVCCSATIANPKDHAETLLGLPAELVAEDSSPHGPRIFALWNPPRHGVNLEERRSPYTEGVDLMTLLVTEMIQTIAFARTRRGAELLFKATQENLLHVSPRLARSVHAYRGGYLPEERREIERRLSEGDLLAVASTNALELGIDIGTLDACLIVGYPGTIASTWQQAGRAGRGEEQSLVILLAENDPIDQYLMEHPEYFFGSPPENAVINPDNAFIVLGHLRSAVNELPLRYEEIQLFGEYAPSLMELLEEGNQVRTIRDRYHWKGSGFPASEVNLRNVTDAVYVIMEAGENGRVIGTMDEYSAFSQVHNHAVYIHEAETYHVKALDTEKKMAFVERQDLDYYTQAMSESRIRVEDIEQERKLCADGDCGFGPVEVNTAIYMFKKIKFGTRDSIGYENLDLPVQTLNTTGTWVMPSNDTLRKVDAHGRVAVEGMTGVANLIASVAPLFVMCDAMDVGATVSSASFGRIGAYIYDKYPDGMGFAAKSFELIEKILKAGCDLAHGCDCPDGCPSCVGAPMPVYSRADVDATTKGRIPDKEAALVILHELLGLEPYEPKPLIRKRRDIAPPAESAEKPRGKPLPPGLERRLRKRLG